MKLFKYFEPPVGCRIALNLRNIFGEPDDSNVRVHIFGAGIRKYCVGVFVQPSFFKSALFQPPRGVMNLIAITVFFNFSSSRLVQARILLFYSILFVLYSPFCSTLFSIVFITISSIFFSTLFPTVFYSCSILLHSNFRNFASFLTNIQFLRL